MKLKKTIMFVLIAMTTLALTTTNASAAPNWATGDSVWNSGSSWTTATATLEHSGSRIYKDNSIIANGATDTFSTIVKPTGVTYDAGKFYRLNFKIGSCSSGAIKGTWNVTLGYLDTDGTTFQPLTPQSDGTASHYSFDTTTNLPNPPGFIETNGGVPVDDGTEEWDWDSFFSTSVDAAAVSRPVVIQLEVTRSDQYAGFGPDMELISVEPQTEQTLSINFGSGTASLSGTETVGVKAIEAGKWVNCSEYGDTGTDPVTPISLTLNDQFNSPDIYAGTTVALSSRGGGWQAGAQTTEEEKMLYAYLDNGGSGEAGVKMTNIPYSQYTVILYFNTDTANSAWQAMRVNGTDYYMASETDTEATEYTGTLDNTAKWGHTNTKTSIDVGVNTMVITGLTGDLIVRSAHAAAGVSIPGTTVARSCMSGIQVVNTGTIVEADQTYTSSTTTQSETLAGQGSTKQIIGIEVVMDGNTTPYSLTAMELGTTGLDQVDNLKVYSTGTSSTFSTDTLVDTVADPTGSSQSLTLDVSTALAGATNYFWVAYDVKADATIGATLDATCTQITINNGGADEVKTDLTVTDPGAGLTITGPADEIPFIGPTSSGDTDYNWDVTANWNSPYVDLTGTYPHKGGTGPYGTTAVVDGGGSIIDVRAQDIEGWALSLDITNANVYFDTLRKIQHGSNVWDKNVTQKINSGGKLIIKNLPAGRHFETCFDVTPENGVVIEGTLDVGGEVDPNYRLNTAGSVSYETVVDNLTHKLTFSVAELGTGGFTQVITRKLISWADTTTGTQTATIAETPVVLDQAETEPLVAVGAEVDLDTVGEYYVYTDTTAGSQGIYVKYVTRALTTPAIGVNVIQTGTELTWTIEEEIGVSHYMIVDADGNELAAPVEADGLDIYTVTLDSDVPAILIIVDNSGYQDKYIPLDGNIETVIYSLEEGWNLITIVVENADTSALGTLWTWNGSAYEMAETVAPTQAVWVYSNEQVEVSVKGEVSDTEMALEIGWNMVGPVENCNIPEEAHTVYGWSDIYNVIADEQNALVRKVGYWIFKN